MHTVTFNRPVKMPGGTAPVGVPLVMENQNAGYYLTHQSDAVEVRPCAAFGRLDAGADYNGKTILMLRPGGYGDLLMLTPLIREIKKRWPECALVVSTSARCAEALLTNPHVDRIAPYPLPLSELESYDAAITFEDALEAGEAGRTLHAVQVFARVAGVPCPDPRMELHLTEDELETARAKYPRTGPRVGIQLFSSSPVRTYTRMGEVIYGLQDRGYEVFCFAAPGQPVVRTNRPGVVNLHGTTFRESCAALATCDAAVCPDSAMTHVAQILGVPLVALYASFPWQLRLVDQSRTVALNGKADCAPCCHHSRGGDVLPAHCPGMKVHRCTALDSIEPDRVVRKVASFVAERWNVRRVGRAA